MKKKLIILIGSIVIVGSTLPITIPQSVNEKVKKEVETIIGRKVKLKKIRYNLFRNILYLDDFSIYEKKEEKEFIKFDSFEINLDIVPLLYHKLSISNIVLKNSTILLKYDKNGSNYVDIIDNIKKYSSKDKKKDSGDKKEGFIRSYSISSLVIKDIKVGYHDEDISGENKFSLEMPKIEIEKNKLKGETIITFNKNERLEGELEGDLEKLNFHSKLKMDEFSLKDKFYILENWLGLEKLEGILNCNLEIEGNLKDNKLIIAGFVNTKNVEIRAKKIGSFLSFKEVSLELKSINLQKNIVDIKNIEVENSKLNIDNLRKYIDEVKKNIPPKKTRVETKIEKKAKPYTFKSSGLANIHNLNIKNFVLINDKKVYNISLEGKEVGTVKGETKFSFLGNFEGYKPLKLDINLRKPRNIHKVEDFHSIVGNLNINNLNLGMFNSLLKQYQTELGGILKYKGTIREENSKLLFSNNLSLTNFKLKDKDVIFNLKDGTLKDKVYLNLRDMSIESRNGKVNLEKVSLKSKDLSVTLPISKLESEKINKKEVVLKNITLDNPFVYLAEEKKKKVGKKRKEKKLTTVIYEYITGLFILPLENKKERKAVKNKNYTHFTLKKGVINNGNLVYALDKTKIKGEKINFNFTNFTTHKNIKQVGKLNLLSGSGGKLKGDVKYNLTRDFDFNGRSINLDSSLSIKRFNLKAIKSLLDQILPNEFLDGKFSYNGKITLKGGKLNNKNDIILHRIKLGKRNNYTSYIPLKTAVALAKDSNGDVKFELPIKGRIGDPNFQIIPLITKELLKLVYNITKTPFRVLDSAVSLTGIGNQVIGYEDGKLDKEGIKKLKNYLKKFPKERVDIVITTLPKKKEEFNSISNLLTKELKEFIKDERIEIIPSKRKGKVKIEYKKNLNPLKGRF